MMTRFQSLSHFRNLALLFILTATLILPGCRQDDPQPGPTPQEVLEDLLAQVDQPQLEADLAIIDDSLAVWGLTDDIDIEPNGVRYLIEEAGTGPTPTLGSPIRVRYRGSLLSSGEEFENSSGQDFYIFQLIIGFQTTLPLFPVGTKATLYIPSGYGYGPTDFRDNSGRIIIPANSNLIFEIEILEIL